MKVAWKVINGYGPYAYLQKSVKYPGGKVISEHVAYLGSMSKPKIQALLEPGQSFKWGNQTIVVPKIPDPLFKQLGKKSQAKIKTEWIDDVTVKLSAPITSRASSSTPAAPAQAPAVAPKSPTKVPGWAYVAAILPNKPTNAEKGEAYQALGYGGVGKLTETEWKEQADQLATMALTAGQLVQLEAVLRLAIKKGNLDKVVSLIDEWGVPDDDQIVMYKVLQSAGYFEGNKPDSTPGTASGSVSQQPNTVAAVADGSVKLPSQSIPAPAVVDNQEKLIRDGKKNYTQDLKQISGKKGSNEGGLFKDTKLNTLHYVKWGTSLDRIKHEACASDLYRLAGVYTPETRIIEMNGKPAIMSDWVDGALPMTFYEMKEHNDVRSGFLVDAWLANWDVVGLTGDNIVRAGLRAYRIDPGGTLKYRAQGSTKQFGPNPAEFETLRDPKIAKQASQVFGDLTEGELKSQAKKLAKISDAEINETVATTFGNSVYAKALATTLRQRRDNLVKLAIPPAAPKPKKLQIAELAKASKLPPEVIEQHVANVAGLGPKFAAIQHMANEAQRQAFLKDAAVGMKASPASAMKVASLFNSWKSHTLNSDSNVLRWASSEAVNGKGEAARKRMEKFWKASGKPVAAFKANLDQRIQTEGFAAVEGVKVHNRANIAVFNARFKNAVDKVSPNKTITIYRAFKPDQVKFLGWSGANVGDKLKMTDPDVYSYSFNLAVAKNFHHGHGGLMVKTDIKARDVLVTDRVSNLKGVLSHENEVLWIRRPAQLEVISVK